MVYYGDRCVTANAPCPSYETPKPGTAVELCGTRDDVRAIKWGRGGGRFAFGATAPFPLPHRRVGSRLFVCVQCVCFLVYIEVCALRVAPLERLCVVPQRTVGALYFFLEASAVAEDVVVVYVAFDESSSHELPCLSHYLPALKAPSFS